MTWLDHDTLYFIKGTIFLLVVLFLFYNFTKNTKGDKK
jgi:hypothetical protein